MSFLKAISFGRSKHKKLPEKWDSSIKQPVTEGIPFYVKYLGSTLVDEPSSEIVTAEAIKTIIALAKASGKKAQRVELVVRPTGILIRRSADAGQNLNHITNNNHPTSEEPTLLNVSIYRISYCSADATHDRIVAFIATNKNETLECHAFLTQKRKIAQAAALTISQAFSIAYERWKTAKNEKRKSIKSGGVENSHPNGKADPEPPLINFDEQPEMGINQSDIDAWHEIDDGFSRLASRHIQAAPSLTTNHTRTNN